MSAPFKAECPHCFTTFNLKNRASAGKKVKCKSCGEPFTVKLIGGAAADDVDNDIEDYGEVEEYGALPPARSSLPPTGASRSKPTQKKAKRKGGAGFPVKPVVIGLIVVAVGVGGWIGISSLPSGGLLTMFDSPESLLDQYLATQYDIMATLESVDSSDDMEWLKGKIDGYAARIKDLNRRMILLSPVSEERAREFARYSDDLRKEHQEQLRDRSKEVLERLKNANLVPGELQEALSGLIGSSFSADTIRPTPKPRDNVPVEIYLAELDNLQRDTAKVLVQIDDLSSARSQLDEIKKLTARYQALKDHENLGQAMPGSPFFSRGISWEGLNGRLSFDAQRVSDNDEQVKQALADLSSAQSALTFTAIQKRSGGPRGPMGGPPGGPPGGFPGGRPGGPGFNPSRPPGQNTLDSATDRAARDKLNPLGLAMHNYHDVHKSFPGIDRDGQGHEGLSWRVHILPFLDQSTVYRQFDLNSDWQSAQNKPLQSKRPDSLKTRYDSFPVTSSLHVFDGPGTPFGSIPLPRFRDIQDGTSNTLMIIEGGRGTAKPWTMPGGLQFTADDPK